MTTPRLRARVFRAPLDSPATHPWVAQLRLRGERVRYEACSTWDDAMRCARRYLADGWDADQGIDLGGAIVTPHCPDCGETDLEKSIRMVTMPGGGPSAYCAECERPGPDGFEEVAFHVQWVRACTEQCTHRTEIRAELPPMHPTNRDLNQMESQP